MSILGISTKLMYFLGGLVNSGLKCYCGSYSNGKAIYHYYEENGERIYHGSMLFTLVYPDYPYVNGTKTAHGNFVNNKKNGRWLFVNRKHGELSKLSISYVDGIAEGYCVLHIRQRDSIISHKGKTVLKLLMRNGMPVGEFRGRFPRCIVMGCCDDKGRPNGLWSLRFTEKDSCTVNYERWEYGVCVDAYEFDNSTGKRKVPKVKITEFLSNYIHQNWLPMTKIMPKGSVEWQGDFNVDNKAI